MQSLQLYEQKLETISSKKVNEEYYASGRASQNNNLEITYDFVTIDDVKEILSKQNIGWNEISKNRIVGHDYDTNVYIELFKERGSNKVILILQKRNQNFLTITNDLQYLLMFILVICIQYWEIFILDIVSVYAKKISLMKRAPIQLLVPVRVIHYNFVSIALEDIFQSVVDCDEWTQGSTLVSDSTVRITARDTEQSGIHVTGGTVQAKNLVLDRASDINLAAGKNTVDVKNTYKSNGWSVGAGISLTGGGLLDINASGNMAHQNGDTHQESYVPTTIKAAQLAQLKAKRDTTIIGSTVSGKKVEVDTGRDLHMQSLQDVDNFKEHSKSACFSISSEPNFKDPTGSISASVGSKGKANSITQSAISDGILTVDGKEIDTKTINTNTENTLHQLDKIFDKKKIEERQELARLFAKNAFEEVHRLSDKYHWKEGGPEKVALHAAIGEITAQLAGNPNGSGAMSAGINQLAIKKIIGKLGKEHPDQVQMLSAVLGGSLNSIIGKSFNVGATMALYGSKWNDLGDANKGSRPVDVIVAVDRSGLTGHVSIIIKYENGRAEEGNYGRYEGNLLVDSSGIRIAAPKGFGTIYIDQNYKLKESSDIKYYYLNLNPEAVQDAFNRNFKNANYVLEKEGDDYQLFRIPGHPDDYRLMEHNCVTVSVKALVDGSGEHPTLNRLRGAVIPDAVENLLDEDYENNRGLVYKVE